MYPREMITYVVVQTWTWVFVATLFIIDKNLEITSMSCDEDSPVKYTRVHPHQGIPLIHKKEPTTHHSTIRWISRAFLQKKKAISKHKCTVPFPFYNIERRRRDLCGGDGTDMHQDGGYKRQHTCVIQLHRIKYSVSMPASCLGYYTNSGLLRWAM